MIRGLMKRGVKKWIITRCEEDSDLESVFLAAILSLIFLLRALKIHNANVMATLRRQNNVFAEVKFYRKTNLRGNSLCCTNNYIKN